MKKDLTIVRKGLVLEVGRFERSHVKGWVAIYSRNQERLGGFSLLDLKLKVIHKFTSDDTLFLTYAINDKEVKR